MRCAKVKNEMIQILTLQKVLNFLCVLIALSVSCFIYVFLCFDSSVVHNFSGIGVGEEPSYFENHQSKDHEGYFDRLVVVIERTKLLMVLIHILIATSIIVWWKKRRLMRLYNCTI